MYAKCHISSEIVILGQLATCAVDRNQHVYSTYPQLLSVNSVEQGKYITDVGVGKPSRGYRSAMHSSSSNDEQTSRGAKRRFIMVAVGIFLFVAGFLATLSAIDDHQTSTSSGDSATRMGEQGLSNSSNAFLLAGILVSLMGVVLATVGPAVGMIRGRS